MQKGKRIDMPFRCGIIGCGRIASEFDDDPKRKIISTHAGAYSNNPQTELVAVSDVNTEKLEKCKKRWNVEKSYTDYKEMLEKEKLDILSICTWSSAHCEIVREAVKHKPKAIFCEKPIATKLSEAKEMVELCKKNDVLLVIDHQRRFDEFHQNIHKMTQEGKLGSVQQATFYYTAGIANTGSHVLDLLRFYLGNAKWVQANHSDVSSPNPDDPNIDGMIKFENGATAMLQTSDVKNYLMFELHLLGTKGKISITRSGFDGQYFEPVESTLFSGYKELFQKEFPFDKDVQREYMKRAVEHIIECIKEKKPAISSGEDGYASLELICALHQSAKEDGKKIALPLKESNITIKSR